MSEFTKEHYKLEGEKLTVFTYPAPVLKQVAKPVVEFNEELNKLVKDMFFTMYHAPGIGLAAPQVGKSIRLFVMDIDFDREKTLNSDGHTEWSFSNFNPMVIINPVFKQKDGEILYEEGCLSVPGVYEDVKRANHVVLEYQDLNGDKQSLEAEGTLAVCLQHENDHLDGIVFLERLSLLKRQFLTKKFLKAKKG
ncbi:MAG: peptide deformylase [Bdellovibrionales bacterium CG12_big_fil_rev_8_21_14_0_65_38_15]|nr:MAG: peptide deformylase [Bdellovibrionales bacterium CG22_combo_CG10-13_8_21_14_all_38_13]PIQ55936.1 MAG: peptide deformylase [Bdellovibrionales bacterium CG12_big_fil_rev_8_21_14_0_65_38_15]PIR29586.1 MAG: peptide deformylase [Bdellovibrionales bacterium CG11_big_fil_rev_8_21_14_0_20_38_13]